MVAISIAIIRVLSRMRSDRATGFGSRAMSCQTRSGIGWRIYERQIVRVSTRAADDRGPGLRVRLAAARVYQVECENGSEHDLPKISSIVLKSSHAKPVRWDPKNSAWETANFLDDLC